MDSGCLTYYRHSNCIHADRAIKADDVPSVLKQAIDQHGAPEHIRSDNGPEFIAKAIQEWLADNDIKTIYIDPADLLGKTVTSSPSTVASVSKPI